MRRTTSGCDRFQTSGGSPNWRPAAKSIVPIAPSARIASPERTKARHFAFLALVGGASGRSTAIASAAGAWRGADVPRRLTRGLAVSGEGRSVMGGVLHELREIALVDLAAIERD